MNKTTRLILAGLLLVMAASAVFLLLSGKEVGRPVARITVNGVIVKEIDLTDVDEPYSFTVDGPGGFSNTIQVEPGRIRVSEAGCPDQVCVHQGYISDGTVPIVCLPNQLIIEITGGGDSLDAATG